MVSTLALHRVDPHVRFRKPRLRESPVLNHVKVYRRSAVAVAAGLLLAGFTATSAAAEDLPSADDYNPVIALDRTEFFAGAWEDGFDVTGTGFIPNGSGYVIYGRLSPSTSSAPAELFETDDEGNFSVHVDPWGDPTTADSPDQEPFVVRAQQLGEGFWVVSDPIPLTITAAPVETEAPTEPPVTPPAVVAPAGEVATPEAAGPQLAETGFEGTLGFAALALLAAGATALLLRRRTASARR